MSKIYWGVTIPKMLYGIEATPMEEPLIELLEENHRQNALLVQNLPTRTPKPAGTSLLGWQSLNEVVHRIPEDHVYDKNIVLTP